MADLNNPWVDDTLGGRANHAATLEKFLVARGQQAFEDGSSFVLNLDAPWGSGKSFFLKRFASQLRCEHVVVMVDAWKSDYAPDPLLPVLSEIQESLKPILSANAKTKSSLQKLAKVGAQVTGAFVVGTAKGIVKKYAGSAIESVEAALTGGGEEEGAASGVESAVDELFKVGQEELSEYQTRERLVREFSDSLAKAASAAADRPNKKAPLFVIVDELDRCRPSYAVQLLERVKHIFSVPGVVFVIATDTTQLRSSIRKVYGADFDAGRYLQRFFNQTYRLAAPSMDAFVIATMKNEGIDASKVPKFWNVEPAKIIADLFSAFRSTPREVRRVLSLLAYVETMKTFKVEIQPTFFVPLAIAIDTGNQELRNGLMRAPGATALRDTLNSMRVSLPSYPNPMARGDSQRKFEILSHLETLLSNMHRPINGFNDDSSSFTHRWVRDLFNRELAIDHQNQWQTGQSLLTSMLTYENLIQSAGELLPPQLESDE